MYKRTLKEQAGTQAGRNIKKTDFGVDFSGIMWDNVNMKYYLYYMSGFLKPRPPNYIKTEIFETILKDKSKDGNANACWIETDKYWNIQYKSWSDVV